MGDTTCFCTLPIDGDADAATLDSCTHLFHFECISKWGDKVNTCPVCKRRFYEVQRISDGVIGRFEDKQANVEQAEEITCMYCGGGGDEARLLLCDGRGCANGAHTSCFGLEEVPRGQWFCTACVSRGNLDVENEDEDEEIAEEEPVTSSSSSAEEAEGGAAASVQDYHSTVAADVRANERRAVSTVDDADSVMTEQSDDDSDSDYSLSDMDNGDRTGRRKRCAEEANDSLGRRPSTRPRGTANPRSSRSGRRSQPRSKARRKKRSNGSRSYRKRASRSRASSKRPRNQGSGEAPDEGVHRMHFIGGAGSGEEPGVSARLQASGTLMSSATAVRATRRSICPRVLASAAAALTPRHSFRPPNSSPAEGNRDHDENNVVQGSFRDAALAAELTQVGGRSQSRELKHRLDAIRGNGNGNGSSNGEDNCSGSSAGEATASRSVISGAARPPAVGARRAIGSLPLSSGLAPISTGQKSRSQRTASEGSSTMLRATSVKCRLERVQIASLVHRLESAAIRQRQLRPSASVESRLSPGGQGVRDISAEAKDALDELGRTVRHADGPSLDMLLACQVLPAIRQWLESVSDGGALISAECPRRTSLLKVLKALPVGKEHLRISGIGKVVMAMVTSNSETAETKAAATQLIKRWSKPFRKQSLGTLELSVSSSSVTGMMPPTASTWMPGSHGLGMGDVVAAGGSNRSVTTGPATGSINAWGREWDARVDVFVKSMEQGTNGGTNPLPSDDGLGAKYNRTTGYVIPKRPRVITRVGDGGDNSVSVSRYGADVSSRDLEPSYL